jgi:hypothetical protein
MDEEGERKARSDVKQRRGLQITMATEMKQGMTKCGDVWGCFLPKKHTRKEGIAAGIWMIRSYFLENRLTAGRFFAVACRWASPPVRFLLEKGLAAGSLSAGEEAQRRLLFPETIPSTGRFCRRSSSAPAVRSRRARSVGETTGGRMRWRRVARGSERYAGRGRCTLGKHLSLGWAH